MKRFAAGLLAFVFLATATLHVLEHVGATDSACSVCAVQQSSVAASAAPVICGAAPVEVAVVAPILPSVISARPACAPARGPPVEPA